MQVIGTKLDAVEERTGYILKRKKVLLTRQDYNLKIITAECSRDL